MTWKRTPRGQSPWRVRRKGSGRYTVEDATGRGVISSHEVAQSNAWLIAAAPDLLEAAKSAMLLLEDTGLTLSDAYQELVEAVAKAEIEDDPQLHG